MPIRFPLVLLVGICGAGLLLGSGATVAAAQQAPEAPPSAKQVSRRMSVAFERFEEGMKERDVERIRESLVDFDGLWMHMPDKHKSKVYKSVKTLFGKLRPRDEFREDGTRDGAEIRYVYETAVGLVFDKPKGADVLTFALKQGHIKEWPSVQAHILTGLGYRQDPKQVSLLSKYLDHDSVAVVSAAARGLGRLSEQDGKLRRDACTRLMKAWEAIDKVAQREARKDPEGPANRDMQLLEAPFTESLTALSRKHYRGFEEWQRWFVEDADEADW